MSEKTMTTEKAMRTVETEITIDAPVDAVWRALTDADEMERWFPLEARVEPGPDGHVFMSWKNEIDFTSPITAWDENRRFAYAWQMESAPGPMVADFHLEAAGGKTVLRLVHSGFPSDPSWDGFYHGVRTGWAFELRSLRHYLERYAGASRQVVYVRRRIAAPLEAVWQGIVGPDGIGLAEDPGDLEEGSPFHAGGLAGSAWSGRVLCCEPGSLFAGTVDELGEALLRFYMDPCSAHPELSDVMVWMSLWGRPEGDAETLQAAFRDRLETLFPNGDFR